MDAFLIGAAFILGLIFGSFGTVVAYRVPRGEPIVAGRSHCPACGKQINALENIPVLSWIFLRGRCRNCGTRISIRYPLAELATGLLFAAAAWKFGWSLEAFVYAGFFWALVILTVIDLEHKLLPNKIVYPTFAVGAGALTIAALLDGSTDRLLEMAIGAAIFGGFFFILAFAYPAGLGGGDLKLAFPLGMFLGYVEAPGVVLVGMFFAFVLGGVVGIAVLIVGKGGRKTQLPFGPFLAAGSMIAILWGQQILDLYLGRG